MPLVSAVRADAVLHHPVLRYAANVPPTYEWIPAVAVGECTSAAGYSEFAESSRNAASRAACYVPIPLEPPGSLAADLLQARSFIAGHECYQMTKVVLDLDPCAILKEAATLVSFRRESPEAGILFCSLATAADLVPQAHAEPASLRGSFMSDADASIRSHPSVVDLDGNITTVVSDHDVVATDIPLHYLSLGAVSFFTSTLLDKDAQATVSAQYQQSLAARKAALGRSATGRPRRGSITGASGAMKRMASLRKPTMTTASRFPRPPSMTARLINDGFAVDAPSDPSLESPERRLGAVFGSPCVPSISPTAPVPEVFSRLPALILFVPRPFVGLLNEMAACSAALAEVLGQAGRPERSYSGGGYSSDDDAPSGQTDADDATALRLSSWQPERIRRRSSDLQRFTLHFAPWELCDFGLLESCVGQRWPRLESFELCAHSTDLGRGAGSLPVVNLDPDNTLLPLIRSLASSASHAPHNLRFITLSRVRLEDTHVAVLLTKAVLATVDELVLSWNSLGDDTARRLASILRRSDADEPVLALSVLRLDGNGITTDGAEQLSSAMGEALAYTACNLVPRLRLLDLRYNRIDSRGQQALHAHRVPVSPPAWSPQNHRRCAWPVQQTVTTLLRCVCRVRASVREGSQLTALVASWLSAYSRDGPLRIMT